MSNRRLSYSSLSSCTRVSKLNHIQISTTGSRSTDLSTRNSILSYVRRYPMYRQTRSDAFASVTEQDQNVPSESKHRNSHGMAWVVVFPCGYRNDSVGALLNHLRNAAPSALPTMDHRKILAPWPLVTCKRCRWTPGMSFHPASWTTPAMSSPFNKQHCRTW